MSYQFEISLSVLNHLGRNLYRNFITVLGEAISNSWDANAKNVFIEINRDEDWFRIYDDGDGMGPDDFQHKFLRVGYSKRKEKGNKSESGRPFIGAKGIGKLAMLSCAKRVTVFSKTNCGELIGGVIDNSGLDEAIKQDLVPDQYELDEPKFEIIEDIFDTYEKGTVLFFEGLNDGMRNSVEHLRKLLALSFQFSLIDKEFQIHVNGEPVKVSDLKAISDRVEFVWQINGYEDELVRSFVNLEAPSRAVDTTLGVSGFLATVVKPRDLKVSGTDERVTVDLFVNGRLRERNILRHVPTQRILESYVFGQLHFDSMDSGDVDPFTSSREGVVEDDKNFAALLDYLKRILIPKVLDDWDKLRVERGKDGDDENTRKSVKQRRARSLYAASREDYKADEGAAGKDEVTRWMNELADDAEFNLGAYSDCFMAENLTRKYIEHRTLTLHSSVSEKAKTWREVEDKHKDSANISFSIRRDPKELSYVDMSDLAFTAEGNLKKTDGASLWQDSVRYRPIRNAVGHTGVLTLYAKSDLSNILENMKGRIRKLLKLNS